MAQPIPYYIKCVAYSNYINIILINATWPICCSRSRESCSLLITFSSRRLRDLTPVYYLLEGF